MPPVRNAHISAWEKRIDPENVVFPNAAREYRAFLHRSCLIKQIGATRDQLSIHGNDPTLLVNGTRTKVSTIMQRFQVMYARRFHKILLLEKGTQEPYMYLDNGLGLQKHHLCNPAKLRAVTRIDAAQLAVLQQKAATFSPDRRAPNTHEHILQIVTNYQHGPATNFHEVLRNAQHGYLQIVLGGPLATHDLKTGDVCQFGFYGPHKPFLPLKTHQGHIQSPDTWIYRSDLDKTIVTNIPVSTEEVDALLSTIRHQLQQCTSRGQALGYRYDRWNCTKFIHTIVKENIGIALPTKVSLLTLLSEITPTLFRQIAKHCVAGPAFLFALCRDILCTIIPVPLYHAASTLGSKGVAIVKIVLCALTAFALNPVRLGLGGILGPTYQAFTKKMRKVTPPLHNLKNLLSLSSYACHLPSALYKWQKHQTSTVTYDHPIGFCVALPRHE